MTLIASGRGHTSGLAYLEKRVALAVRAILFARLNDKYTEEGVLTVPSKH